VFATADARYGDIRSGGRDFHGRFTRCLPGKAYPKAFPVSCRIIQRRAVINIEEAEADARDFAGCAHELAYVVQPTSTDDSLLPGTGLRIVRSVGPANGSVDGGQGVRRCTRLARGRTSDIHISLKTFGLHRAAETDRVSRLQLGRHGGILYANTRGAVGLTDIEQPLRWETARDNLVVQGNRCCWGIGARFCPGYCNDLSQ